MAVKPANRNPVALSDLAASVLDPVLRKRAGISVALVQSWEEIAGAVAGRFSRPEKIVWPRGRSGEGAAKPATLVIAAEAGAALELQHQTGELMARVNGFLGFNAIGRVKIVRKPVANAAPAPRPRPLPLGAGEAAVLRRRLEPIEDDALRQSLERLGASVLGQKRRGFTST